MKIQKKYDLKRERANGSTQKPLKKLHFGKSSWRSVALTHPIDR